LKAFDDEKQFGLVRSCEEENSVLNPIFKLVSSPGFQVGADKNQHECEFHGKRRWANTAIAPARAIS